MITVVCLTLLLSIRFAGAVLRCRRCWSLGSLHAALVGADHARRFSLCVNVVSTMEKANCVTFQSALATSSLCDAEVWSSLDINSLAELYDTQITSILNRLFPMRAVRCRRRASDAWLDDDCRSAKRSIRLFECDIRHVRRQDSLDTTAITAVTAAWSERHHEYSALLYQKRETF